MLYFFVQASIVDQKREKACIKNITLKTIPTVAMDCVLILPTKNVSTRLYILVSSIEKMVGIAIAPITR